MKSSNFIYLVMTLLAVLFLAACSGETTSGMPDEDSEQESGEELVEEEVVEAAEFSDEEVTLRVATPWGVDHFMDRIGDHIEESIPHMTLEHLDWDGTA